MKNHLDYLHYNPVKHKWVPNVRAWPYSTFHRYIQEGIDPRHWGDGEIHFQEDVGDE
ncbi:hypothetical protein WDW89_20780 [Deltaproteobacteria bacterium TL4]